MAAVLTGTVISVSSPPSICSLGKFPVSSNVGPQLEAAPSPPGWADTDVGAPPKTRERRRKGKRKTSFKPPRPPEEDDDGDDERVVVDEEEAAVAAIV